MRNYRSLAVTFVLSLSLLPQAGAGQTPELRQTLERIAGAILVNGHSMDYLRNLTDKFGSRLTGSVAYQRAAEWAAAEFRAAGIKNVRLEPFTITHGWERGAARGRLVAPVDRALHFESLGWSPSTSAGGVEGEVLLLSDLAPEKIKAQAEKIKGRLVIIDMDAISAEGINGFARIMTSMQLFKDAGARAILMPDREANNVFNASSVGWGTELNPLPIAQVGMEDSKLIRRLLEREPVTIEFQIENRVSGPVEVNNVIAEIRGREKPDEWLIIGAHLDSWDYGTGAQDNGSGVAMVLEAARAIASSGHAPRRSIRFALWGGEEQGLLGSAAYVRAHRAELGKCVASLNTDTGAGHPRGWRVGGRSDVGEALKPLSRSLLVGLEADAIAQRIIVFSDDTSFIVEGIPSLDLWVDLTHYGEIHHKSSDTLDKVNTHNLAAGAAVVAVTAYAIAERAEPLAPRSDRAAVDEILKQAKLDDFLRAVGVWK